MPETRADEARRVAEDLQANQPMERAIEFEPVAYTTELERAVAAEREKAEAAETSVQQLTFKLGSLHQHAPLGRSLSSRPPRSSLTKGEGLVQTWAACRVALEARGRDPQAQGRRGGRRRRRRRGGADARSRPRRVRRAHIAAAQAAAGVAP